MDYTRVATEMDWRDDENLPQTRAVFGPHVEDELARVFEGQACRNGIDDVFIGAWGDHHNHHSDMGICMPGTAPISVDCELEGGSIVTIASDVRLRSDRLILRPNPRVIFYSNAVAWRLLRFISQSEGLHVAEIVSLFSGPKDVVLEYLKDMITLRILARLEPESK